MRRGCGLEWVLLLVAGLRLGTPAAPTAPPWRWRTELSWALLCGVTVGLLSGAWWARFYLSSGAVISSDFLEHCDAVAALADGTPSSFSRNRSVLVAWPSVLLGRALGLGMVDRMVAASSAAVGLLAAGLCLWGRALHGRLAGVAAALSVGPLLPLVLLSRTLSFYPEVAATFTLAAGLTAVALHLRTATALLVAAAAVTLCFLVDLRGLIPGLAFLGLLVAAALAARPGVAVLRLAMVLGVVALGWCAAPVAYSAATFPLETQLNLSRRLQDRGLAVPVALQQPAGTAYVWGFSDPREIPRTLWRLQVRAAQAPAALAETDKARRLTARYLTPWKTLAFLSAGLGVVGLSRQRWRLLALVGTLAPFGAALRGAMQLQESMLRFVASAEPGLALLLGLALAVLIEGAPREGLQPSRRGRLGMLAALLLALGAIPSDLSPAAGWRQHMDGGNADLQSLAVQVRQAGAPVQGSACADHLQRDWQERHLPPEGSLYAAPQLPPAPAE